MDFTDIETIALRDVLFTRLRRAGASADFHVRRIFREYSRKFHTPLHVVYELPIEFVVQAWLEEFYEDAEDEVLWKEVRQLLKTEEEILAEREAEDQADADAFIELGLEARNQTAAMKKIEDAVKEISNNTSLLRGLVPLTHEEQKTGERRSRQAEIVNVRTKPAEAISMTFAPLDEEEGFGLLDDPKRK